MPYAPHDDAPTLNIWIVSGENATSTGTSGAGSGFASPRPGAATKKSSRWLRPVGEVSSMNPPAPGPVSSDSDANDTSTAATAASTALPPARRTSAPASAVTGCPAATTPLMRGRGYPARRDADSVRSTPGRAAATRNAR